MPKVLFFSGQREEVGNIFCEMAPEGFEASWRPHDLKDDEKKDLIKDVEFLVLHPGAIAGGVLTEGRSLRLIQLLSAGYDKMDLALAAKLGIPVATNGGANAWAVAEHSVAMLLALYKRILQCDRSVRAGQWRKNAVTGFNTFELAEKTVGIIGAGNIGRKVAGRLKSFETRILYCDLRPAPDIEKALGARRVSLDELLRDSDIITIHTPLLRETRCLIGERELALMKPTAVLINTSRGSIVDEAALAGALSEMRIAGAGLDVFDREPIPMESPLLKFENVLFSPHIAGHSYEAWFRRSSFAWANIQQVASGRPPLSIAIPEEA
ncbi:MAG: lactate dehydrogenase [Deltaproteobacteria bacterium]|nr:lactate dehydrogenase [Deltaproteobacteria bacterium]